METVILTGLGIAGQGCAVALSGAIGELYTSLKTKCEHKHFQRICEELDVRGEIEIIEALFEDLKSKKNHHHHHHAIEVCSRQIHELVTAIHGEVEAVNLKLIDEQYAKYYFGMWSPTTNNQNVENLKSYTSQLIKKRDLLIKLLQVD